MTRKDQLGEELLTPGAVAALLYVDRKTIARWVQAGKLDAVRTPGGHHRFRTSDVMAIRDGAYQRAGRAQDARVPSPHGEREDDSEPTADALAAAVVAEAVAVALEAEAEEAAQADELLRAQARAAADRAAAAAHRASGARAFASAKAAESVARDAVRTATRVQIRADVAASQVAAVTSASIGRLLAEGGDAAGDRMAILAADAETAAELTARDVYRAAGVALAAREAAAALQPLDGRDELRDGRLSEA